MATDTICSSYTHGIRRIDKGNNLHVVSPQPLAHEKRLTQMEFSPKYFPLRPRSHRNCAETAPRLHCLTACPGNEFTKSCDACFAASIRVPPSTSSSLIDHDASSTSAALLSTVASFEPDEPADSDDSVDDDSVLDSADDSAVLDSLSRCATASPGATNVHTATRAATNRTETKLNENLRDVFMILKSSETKGQVSKKITFPNEPTVNTKHKMC